MPKLFQVLLFLVTPALFVPQIKPFPPPISTEDLVLHLPMDDIPQDLSPYHHHVSATHVFPTADRFGNTHGAMAFHGKNSQILVQDEKLLRLSNTDFTISLWMMEYAYNPHNNAALIVKRGLGSNKGWFVGSLGTRKSLQGNIQYAVSGGGDPALFTETEALSLHTWHHIAVTYQIREKKISVYIDGALHAVKAYFQPPNPGADAPVSIGFDIPTDMYALNGKLDDIFIFRRRLSYNEILNLYNAD